MESGLEEKVMLERVEMIARLTSDRVCTDKDREIALNLIAEIASEIMFKSNKYMLALAPFSLMKERLSQK